MAAPDALPGLREKGNHDMGIMDKVKAQAEQAIAKAQQGVTEGKAKVDAYQQSKHSRDALLRELGAAYYAAARAGGSQEAVDAALAALDADDAAARATQAGSPTDGTMAPPTASPAAPEGGFKLDDI